MEMDKRKLLSDEEIANLAKSGVEFVRLAWCDNRHVESSSLSSDTADVRVDSNVVRCRLLSLSRFASIQKSGTGVTPSSFAGFQPVFDVPAPGSGMTATGNIQLMPDGESCRILPHAPNHALVFAMGYDQETGKPDALCARSFLKRNLARLKDEYGLELRVGIELEFYLLEPNTGKPADQTVYAEMTSLHGQAGKTFQTIVRALAAAGMDPYISHSESGPGQFEVALDHCGALEAADTLLIVRDLIRDLAQRDGLHASFAPKPVQGEAGSGCHVHLSLCDASGRNVFPASNDDPHPTGISAIGRQFMAGILRHLVALSLITLPSHQSYERVTPHSWAGSFVCWGFNNREATLRVPGYGDKSNFEVKCCDHTANMFLALGALFAAGLDGIAEKLELPEPMQDDPADVSRSDIVPLPSSLSSAILAFENSDFCREMMGGRAFKAFLAVRKYENDVVGAMSADQRRKLYVTRY